MLVTPVKLDNLPQSKLHESGISCLRTIAINLYFLQIARNTQAAGKDTYKNTGYN